MIRLTPISPERLPTPSPERNSTVEPSEKPLSALPSLPSSQPELVHQERQSKLAELKTPRARILDFDIETRLVGFYQAGRFKPAGCEPIAIGCSWVGEDEVHSVLLSEASHDNVVAMLEWFLEFYAEATMVTGHYITKFDLPILNGACLEWGLPPMSGKLAQDTKTGLITFEGLSKSQENLSKMLQIGSGKYHMSDADWRRATRLTSGGQKRERKRVESDVRQHKEMREELLRRGMLNPPVMWKP